MPCPSWVTYTAGGMLGALKDDIVLTKDEIEGLKRNLLVSNAEGPAPAPTKLTEWLQENGKMLGRKYASEVALHYR